MIVALLLEPLNVKHAFAVCFSTLITGSISRPNKPVCILFSLQTFSEFALSAVTYGVPTRMVSRNFRFQWRGQKRKKKQQRRGPPVDHPEEK